MNSKASNCSNMFWGLLAAQVPALVFSVETSQAEDWRFWYEEDQMALLASLNHDAQRSVTF